MATQIFETDPTVVIPRSADVYGGEDPSRPDPRGGAFRGFFFAMLFNLFLVLTGAAGWELWRLMR